MSDLTGKTLGPYLLGEPIGSGGMATVYKAFQPSMNRAVAVKVLPAQLAQNPGFLARFRQEAHIIARLEHAHILPVYDYGESDGQVFIVMRYLDGGSLHERIDQARLPPPGGPLPLREVNRYLAQVSAALDYAHAQGVVHRDIKPSNVLIDRPGDAFLTDFGIAKMTEGTLDLTGTGVIGTPQYMSPEQGQGLAVDGRSDVYSLGVMLYEMLTGRVPFEGDTPIAIVLQHVTAPLPPARTIAPHLPDSIEAVLRNALAKSPADRYATAGELAAAFEAAVRADLQPGTRPAQVVAPTQPSRSMPPTVAAGTPIRVTRPAWKVAVAAAVILGLMAILAAAIAMRPLPTGPAVGATLGSNIIVLTPDSGGTPAPAESVPTPGAAAACVPIVADAFDAAAGPFPRGESSRAEWGYADGEYRIFMKLANEFEAPILRQDFTEYAVEAEARFASDRPGAYGLVLGADPTVTRYMTFLVDDAQRFAVTRHESSGTTTLREWTLAPSLNAGQAANRLRAVRLRDALALYANDVLLAAITDTLDLPASPSRVGLFASSFERGGIDVRFDNFRVCQAPASPWPTNVSLDDAFDDDRNAWGAVRYEGGLSAFIEDGQFQLSVPYQDPVFQLFHWNPTFATGDFEMEIDSRLLEGPDTSRVGLLFGVQDVDNGYILYASDDGLLSLYRRVDGDQQAIVLDRPTTAIRGGGQANHWQIVVENGLLTVTLNGEPVLPASIAYQSGAIGFACEPGGPPLARCGYDNLSVRGAAPINLAIVSPLCNCRRQIHAGQPVDVAVVWNAADALRVEEFLSSITMTASLDGRPIDNPLQYWSSIETGPNGEQTRWSYPLVGLAPGSHIVEFQVASEVQLTDGRDANGDGRPDTFGPGDLLDGYVQIISMP